MIIHFIDIDNITGSGADYWKRVEAAPDEPLIEATVRMTLTSREYHDLLDKSTWTGITNDQTK